MLDKMMKSIIDQDRASVVICDLDSVIVYMNPAAQKNYAKRGGAELVGKNLMNCHNADSQQKITEVLNWFKASTENNIIYTFYNEKQNKDVYMVALRDENKKLIGYFEKHEFRDHETAQRYDYSKSLV